LLVFCSGELVEVEDEDVPKALEMELELGVCLAHVWGGAT